MMFPLESLKTVSQATANPLSPLLCVIDSVDTKSLSRNLFYVFLVAQTSALRRAERMVLEADEG